MYRFEGDEVFDRLCDTAVRWTLTQFQDITECWLDTDQDVSRWLEKVLDGGQNRKKSRAKSKNLIRSLSSGPGAGLG